MCAGDERWGVEHRVLHAKCGNVVHAETTCGLDMAADGYTHTSITVVELVYDCLGATSHCICAIMSVMGACEFRGQPANCACVKTAHIQQK